MKRRSQLDIYTDVIMTRIELSCQFVSTSQHTEVREAVRAAFEDIRNTAVREELEKPQWAATLGLLAVSFALVGFGVALGALLL